MNKKQMRSKFEETK